MRGDALRVLVDGTQLTGQSSRSGIGTYVRELIGGLARDPTLNVDVMATPEASVPAGVTKVTVRRQWRYGRKFEWEHGLLRPFTIFRSPADVIHNPNFLVSRVQRDPWVATLFDVAPLMVEDPNIGRLRRQMERFGPRLSRAAAVIAISRFAADGGMKYLGLSPDSLHVVHLAASRDFKPDGPAAESEPPYLLVVSEYQKRKGFDRAFAVCDALADAGYPHVLKIAGRVNFWVEDELRSLINTTRHPDRIELLGFVDDLPALYRGASLTLIPSTYEGFGLPVLESMSCGTPVVSFDNSALPEIVGTGGVVVPDGDIETMVKAARRVIDSESYRAEQREAALSWSSRFSWETCVQAHAEIYRTAAGR